MLILLHCVCSASLAPLLYFTIIHSLQMCFHLHIINILNLCIIVPSQVTGVSLFKTERTGRPALRVTWTTPQSDVSISKYKVQYRRSGTTSWSSAAPVSGSTTSTYLEGLVVGSEYQVRVRAVSAIGSGMWSAVKSETTYSRK